MRGIMLDAAMGLMQSGLIPSVSDVAEAAQVSRATAYRYFPTQAALIQAAVDEALGPILAWKSDSTDPGERVTNLVTFAYPRMESYEATLRPRCAWRLNSGRAATPDSWVTKPPWCVATASSC